MDLPADPIPRRTAKNAVTEMPQRRVFLVVFLCTIGFLLVGPYGNVSPIGTLDPWIYTGYFLNFSDMLERFGHTYYLSRAPYVYPGVVLYCIFSPAVANLILNTLLWTGIVAPVYLIARRCFGLKAALFAATVVYANPYIGSAIGWDYPDGPSLTYVALGLWLALAPPSNRRPNLWLALAGACWTMAFLSNMIAALIVVSAAITVVFWRFSDRKQTAFDLLVIGVGALLSLGVWCVASKVVIGHWNILAPQLEQIAYARSHPEYLPEMWGRDNDWIPHAYRLLAPPLAMLGSGLMLMRWRSLGPTDRRALLGSGVGLLVVAGLFTWCEFGAHKVLLRVFYHSTYLAIPTLFSLVVVGALILREEARWAWARLGFTLAAGFAPIFWRWHSTGTLDGRPGVVAFGIALPLLLCLLWRRTAFVGVAACFFAISFSLARDVDVGSYGIRPREAVFIPDSTEKIVSGKALYQHEIAADFIVFIKNLSGRNRSLRLWYDHDDPQHDLYDSLYALYLWGTSDLTKEFKEKPMADLQAYVTQFGRVVHLTTEPGRVEAHRQAMEARGVQWREIGSWTLGRRGKRVRIVIDEVIFPETSTKP